MRKVIFYCNWGESPSEILARYRKQTPNCSGVWKEIEGVEEPRDADFFVVLEGLAPRDSVDLDRTVFLKREPDYISNMKSMPFRHSLDWSGRHCGVVWWLSMSYDELKKLPYPEKTNKASCVVSSKHRHRKEFIRSLFGRKFLSGQRNAPSMDLYGRGHSRLFLGKNYKGPIGGASSCKLSGLLPYEYSMVLENSQQVNYWTEKLADAFLSWCVPIYWGCPNLSDYFSDESFRVIDLNASAAEIDQILEGEIDSSTIEHLSLARNKILDEYNIWEVVRREIELADV